MTIPKAIGAIIGGTSTSEVEFAEYDGVTVLDKVGPIDTPFGEAVQMLHLRLSRAAPADPVDVLYVPMHGWSERNYVRISGTESAFWVLREAGVRAIVTTGTVGGINHLLDPSDLIVPTDFLDFRKTHSTAFCQDKIVRMKDPICPQLHASLVEVGKQRTASRIFRRGVYAATENGRFESPAEIAMYGRLGGDVVGKSLVPEVYLARALNACFAGIYVVSNYAEGVVDDWTAEEFYAAARGMTRSIVAILIAALQRHREGVCSCASHSFDKRW
jgi:5'-methylthioadenosine phosphorylase